MNLVSGLAASHQPPAGSHSARSVRRSPRSAHVAAAMDAIARQPEGANILSRTAVRRCLAMIETMAIYCLVIALLLLFANPLLK